MAAAVSPLLPLLLFESGCLLATPRKEQAPLPGGSNRRGRSARAPSPLFGGGQPAPWSCSPPDVPPQDACLVLAAERGHPSSCLASAAALLLSLGAEQLSGTGGVSPQRRFFPYHPHRHYGLNAAERLRGQGQDRPGGPTGYAIGNGADPQRIAAQPLLSGPALLRHRGERGERQLAVWSAPAAFRHWMGGGRNVAVLD